MFDRIRCFSYPRRFYITPKRFQTFIYYTYYFPNHCLTFGFRAIKAISNPKITVPIKIAKKFISVYRPNDTNIASSAKCIIDIMTVMDINLFILDHDHDNPY